MAAGYLTKQAVLLTARYLNDVNDSVAGGAVLALPSGVQAPPWSQTIPGDRICLDDASALALSDTTIGTLYGGIYQYTQAKTTTLAIALGGIAFWKQADVGTAYIVYGDAQPAAATPSFIAGIFINAITSGNYGWIQCAGVATVLFAAAITATTVGSLVTAKVSATGAENGATVTQETVASQIGVSIQTAAAATASQVAITRSPFGRL